MQTRSSIREGDPVKSLFVLLKDEVAVENATIEGESERLSTLTKGECFGELSLVDHSPRSVTVRALGLAEVLSFEADALDPFFDTQVDAHRTILKNLATTTSGRLRRLDEVVVESAYDSVLVIDHQFQILKYRQVTNRGALLENWSGVEGDLFFAVPWLGEGVHHRRPGTRAHEPGRRAGYG